MPKTSTDLAHGAPIRHSLNGPVMGTRWTAVAYSSAPDVTALHADLAACVVTVDRQMSTWKPDSDLSRLNAAPVGAWLPLPPELLHVISAGLVVGAASGGAFDIGLGDLVTAWGFGAAQADVAAVRDLINKPRPRADQIIEVNSTDGTLRKRAPIQIDLNGIAKGFAVDQMIAVLATHGVENALAGLDGELRAIGTQPDGMPWSIAVERPDYGQRAPEAILSLENAAVATSGDYRHWIEVGSRRLSHTMDITRGGPLNEGPASVTVAAETCMLADAWATALMVMGSARGAELARTLNLHALFLDRVDSTFRQTAIGPLFAPAP
jgi:thiamine biosynthesis lipoprotein